jgi:choline-sulfatase
MPSAKNLIVIMSDEHNPKVAGYAGHPVISTPNLDRVAAAGTRFTSAYTPSPICVPARASFITGQPVHVHRAWDNAIAYGGVPPGWAHMLRDRGHTAVSIGKLHYKGHDGDDYGFSESRLAMHIADGVGGMPKPGRAIILFTIARSRRMHRSGCARPAPSVTISRGFCSCPWCPRISP